MQVLVGTRRRHATIACARVRAQQHHASTPPLRQQRSRWLQSRQADGPQQAALTSHASALPAPCGPWPRRAVPLLARWTRMRPRAGTTPRCLRALCRSTRCARCATTCWTSLAAALAATGARRRRAGPAQAPRRRRAGAADAPSPRGPAPPQLLRRLHLRLAAATPDLPGRPRASGPHRAEPRPAFCGGRAAPTVPSRRCVSQQHRQRSGRR